jgi:hypothetical protein
MTDGNIHFRPINDVTGSGTGVALDVLNDASTTVQDLAFRGATTIFRNASGETIRIDSSGRLLINTSTSTSSNGNSITQVASTSNDRAIAAYNFENDASGPYLTLGKSRGTSVGSFTILQNNDELGNIAFFAADGSDLNTEGARIQAEVDGTPGTNDMPTRLVFATTADGANSPTERMRINSSGRVYIGTTATNPAVANASGSNISADGLAEFSRDGNPALYVNRVTNDGELVHFRQGGTKQGSISVSGDTVSYNGGHLSRWSQLPGGVERTEILRGSVLSNIDEMCEWGDENNEQLNRMKVSDVEGDRNVAGVFQSWDDDDDTYTNDFYCAMTGDFIIRIAQGVTVERGDLLMSAGDGTAKPQDDDIIRSKTVAKVTSTHVSETYADGSYCVPCVLMAC